MADAETPSMPSGACDCHVHVIGPQADYAMVVDRHYTPPEAGVPALRAHLERLGFERTVVIQPSVYGVDNRCLLDSLKALGAAGRGVAVLDFDVTDDGLARLHAAGVRGLRINLESSSVRDPQAVVEPIAAWSKRLAPLGWHIQVYAGIDLIVAAAPWLMQVPVPLVFDHFAGIAAGTPLDDPRVQAVRALLADGPAYVKLSAPYRVGGGSEEGAATLTALAHHLVESRPDRLLWGSDWPHTNREAGKATHEVSRYRDIAPSRLQAGIDDWLPTSALRQQVLVDNPARLYAF
jgi:predicted TIM-barrel fold metal-dependent hydrolase